MTTVVDLFRGQAGKRPDKSAVSAPDGSLTYRELDQLSDSLAARLMELHPAGEPIIGILTEPSLPMIIAVFGVLKAGGCYLPLDPSWPDERLQFLIRDSGLATVVTTSRHAQKIDNMDLGLIFLSSPDEKQRQNPQPIAGKAISPEQLAYVIYTSGSTGQPKGVMVEHKALMTFLDGFSEFVSPSPETRLLSVAPFTFDASVIEIFVTLCYGGTLFLSNAGSLIELTKVLDFISANRINTMYLPPMVLQTFARLAASGRYNLPLKWLIVGVEPIRQGLLAEIVKGIPSVTIINAYGPTETAVIATCHRFETATDPDRRTPIGRPLQGYTVFLADSDFRLAQPGEEGQILIAGDGLARGYLNKPGLTAEAFRMLPIDGEPPRRFYLTGDYGIYLENGEIEFVSRKDDQVKIRGFRIETGEIETALHGHPSIDHTVIIPISKDGERKSLVCFYSTLNHQPLDGLREFLLGKLPGFMAPSSFIHLEQFPWSERGKVDKKQLEQRYLSGFNSTGNEEAAQSVEELLQRLYSETLNLQFVPGNESLISLGGDSISAMMLLVRIEEETGLRIPPDVFNRNSSIDQLSRVIGEQDFLTETIVPDESEDKTGHFPLSLSQEELWILHELDTTGIKYNTVTRIRIAGSVDAGRLTRAIQKAIGQYDIFGMAIKRSDHGVEMQPFLNQEPIIKINDLRTLNDNERSDWVEAYENAAGRTPFHLPEPPLFAIDLVLLKDGLSFLYFTIDHLIFDGWSLGILVQDILEFYTNDHARLPAHGIRAAYSSYARWTRSMMNQGKWDHQLEFWKKKLHSIPAPLMIHRSEKRDVNSAEGCRYWWKIPENLHSALRDFARKNGMTKFTALLSAYGLLLYLLTRREKMIIGTAYANRNVPKFHSTPGYFINMVALIVEPDPLLSGLEYLKKTGSFSDEAFSNAQYPFGALIRELNIAIDPGQPSFFEAMFVLQNWAAANYASHGIHLEQQEIGNGTFKADLLLNITEKETESECWFEYPKDLFTRQEVERMATVYLKLLADLIAFPEKTVAGIAGPRALLPVAHLMGSGTLLISCLDHLLNNGWLVASVISGDDTVISYVQKKKIPAHSISAGIEMLMKEQQNCTLFSINNDFIIPEKIISRNKITAINYHNSLLPQYAGLHASNWVLINREKFHGISWHLVGTKIDAGDLVYQKEFPVEGAETVESLNLRCYGEAFKGFQQITADLKNGTLSPRPQILSGRSYFGLADRPGIACLADFSHSAESLIALSFAMNCPNTINEFGVLRLCLEESWYLLPSIFKADEPSGFEPGTMIRCENGRCAISTGSGAVAIGEVLDQYGFPVQLEEWYKRHRLTAGKIVPVIRNGDDQSIRMQNRSLIKNEHYWATRLSVHQPLRLPMVMPKEKPESQNQYDLYSISFGSFSQSGVSNDPESHPSERRILALIMIFIAKWINQEKFEIPCSFQQNNLLPVSRFVPLLIRIEPDLDFSGLMDSVIEQILDQEGKGSFFSDLFYRYPAIRRIPEEERFFSNQILVSIKDPGIEIDRFNSQHTAFIINPEKRALEIRCTREAPYHRPAQFLAERFLRFSERVANQEGTFRTSSLLNNDDLKIITGRLNPSGEPVDPDHGFLAIFRQVSRDYPNQTAILSERQPVSYRQLDTISNDLALKMHALGFRSGELAGVMLERSAMLVSSMIAVMKAGGAFLPIDPESPGLRIEEISAAARLGWLITTRSHAKSIPESISHVIFAEEMIAGETAGKSSEPLPEPDLSAPAYVIFTSGTTGRPKGVIISHKALAAFILSAKIQYRLTPADRILQFASIAFDTAIEEIFPALCTGACVVLRSSEMVGSVDRFLEQVGLMKITILDLPTAYWHQLVRNIDPDKKPFPPEVRMVIIGGERANPEIARLWGKLVGQNPELVNTYGPTETTVVATCHRFDPSEGLEDFPIGKPLESVRVWVADRDLNPVLPWHPGELLIGGPQVASGFLGEDSSAITKIVHLQGSAYPDLQFFRSGDLVCYDENGLLYHLGRNDRQVKIRGFRVDPSEIDRLMLQIEGVTASITIPYGEEERKKLACYFTRRKGRNLHVGQVSAFLSAHLPVYLTPSVLMEIDEIPLSLSNKVDIRALPDPLDGPQKASAFSPETETERKLIEQFRQILPGVTVDAGSNFFSLGGDSLDAITLLSALSREFGSDLPLRRFYELPDLRSVAKELDHYGAAADQQTPEIIRSTKVPRHISILQSSGDKTPLFIVYGDRANTFLPGFLGPGRPLYTLLPQGSDGEEITERSVESIASLYLREIEEMLPAGKYHIAGFSFGGLIALEMALQLRKAGRETGRVTVIDTAAPHLFRSIIHKVSWQNKIENWMKWIRIKSLLAMGKPVPPVYRNSYVLRSFRQAACRYSPEISGIQFSFRLIKSARSISPEPDLGWSLWNGFLPEITIIDGDHFSIIRDPEHVRQFASLLVD